MRAHHLHSVNKLAYMTVPMTLPPCWNKQEPGRRRCQAFNADVYIRMQGECAFEHAALQGPVHISFEPSVFDSQTGRTMKVWCRALPAASWCEVATAVQDRKLNSVCNMLSVSDH